MYISYTLFCYRDLKHCGRGAGAYYPLPWLVATVVRRSDGGWVGLTRRRVVVLSGCGGTRWMGDNECVPECLVRALPQLVGQLVWERR